jgi:hypothetical protein
MFGIALFNRSPAPPTTASAGRRQPWPALGEVRRATDRYARYRDQVPISFDTSGLQQFDNTTWGDPATRDIIKLTYFDLVPDLPVPLTELDTLRTRLAEYLAATGCLIEAYVIEFDSVPTLLRIEKLPMPDQQAGLAFAASLTVPKSNCSAVLQILCPETGITGVREATLAIEIGFENMYPPHPYAPGLHGALPYSAADDYRWDDRFPDHPLTRARRWVSRTVESARIDPEFASLPPFGG